MIRTEAGMPIARFSELIGMPRRTYTRRRSRWLAGEPVKGPWPAPVVEAIEPTVAKLAEAWPAWGHRTIAALHAIEHPDLVASVSSVQRAMPRRGAAAAGRLPGRAASAGPGPPRSVRRSAHTPRTRCGSWTSPSSKRLPVGSGGSPAAPIRSPSTSSAGESHRPGTATTRSPPSSSRSTRSRSCWATACSRTSPTMTASSTR